VSATNKTENMKEKRKGEKGRERERKGKRTPTEIFLNHLQFCQQDGLKKLPT